MERQKAEHDRMMKLAEEKKQVSGAELIRKGGFVVHSVVANITHWIIDVLICVLLLFYKPIEHEAKS